MSLRETRKWSAHVLRYFEPCEVEGPHLPVDKRQKWMQTDDNLKCISFYTSTAEYLLSVEE